HRFGHEATMAFVRRRHTVTTLSDGHVLAIGGWDDGHQQAVGAIEAYDPVSRTWSMVTNLSTPRINHIAALLPPDGSGHDRVLITGGQRAWGQPALGSTEIFVYDGLDGNGKVTGHLIVGPPLNDARGEFASVKLGNGQIAVIGGWGNNGVPGVELYTPDGGIGAFTRDAALQVPRSRHSALILNCPNGQPCTYAGKVLVLGGWLVGPIQGAAVVAEIYDPVAHSTTKVGSMLTERAQFSAIQLSTGKVIVAGGDQRGGIALSSIETYDPATEVFTLSGELAV